MLCFFCETERQLSSDFVDKNHAVCAESVGIWDLPCVVECFDRASPFLSIIIF